MRTGHIKSKSFAHVGLRFDASYHMSEGVESRRIVESSPYGCYRTQDVAEDIFIGPRARRYYVSNPANGISFLSSSDILLADLENIKLASKKYMPADEMMLEKGWTLITRSGTIGNCAFANAKHAQKLASEHVIRLKPNNILRAGAIFAFFASRYGHSLLTQGTFGGVIQHIEPPFVGSLPIPKFPEAFQKEVDELVQESARLREEATDALNQAYHLIEKHIPFEKSYPKERTSIKSIVSSHQLRFEGFYYKSNSREVYDYVTSKYNHKTLDKLTSNIFRPGIFKRKFVNNSGIAFLGGADILMAIPSSSKQLSKSQVASMPELIPKEGWILATCGGTIGKTVLVDKQLANCAVSQHVMRIVPNGEVPEGYLFAFLSSNIGFNLITLFTYGSVIPQVEPHHLRLIPVPILDKEDMDEIHNLVMVYKTKNEKAKYAELKAISMVEQEIDKWNK